MEATYQGQCCEACLECNGKDEIGETLSIRVPATMIVALGVDIVLCETLSDSGATQIKQETLMVHVVASGTMEQDSAVLTWIVRFRYYVHSPLGF